MWRNYLTVGFRALARSKTYAFINIFGLALGLAACLLLLIYVRYETSYDRWLPDADRVYQVQAISTAEESGEPVAQQGSHGVITESLAKDFPQIEAIVRAEGVSPVFLRDGEADVRADVPRRPQFLPDPPAAFPSRRSAHRIERHGQPGAEPDRGDEPASEASTSSARR